MTGPERIAEKVSISTKNNLGMNEFPEELTEYIAAIIAAEVETLVNEANDAAEYLMGGDTNDVVFGKPLSAALAKWKDAK